MSDDELPFASAGPVGVHYARCWACMCASHFDPPKRHDWADQDDIDHAAATGQPSPAGKRCACWCADEPTDTGAADARLLAVLACLAAWVVLLLLGQWRVVALWALLGLGLYAGFALTEWRRDRRHRALAEQAFLASLRRPPDPLRLPPLSPEALERLRRGERS